MLLRYGNVRIIITVIFISVAQSLKFGTPRSVKDPISSEIKRNISVINHALRDLVKKYAELKTRDGILARLNKEKSRLKVHPNDDINKENANIELRAKAKSPIPRKSVDTTLYYTDKSSENSELTNKEKNLDDGEIHDDKDSVSAESQEENQSILEEVKTKMKPTLYLASLNQDKRLERKDKLKKVLSISDIKSESKEYNPKVIRDPQDVEKVLVIHLGDKEQPRLKKKKQSSPKQVSIQSTIKIQLPTTTKTHPQFKSETTRPDDSDLEDDKEMKKEILRAIKLRQSYSDACSKVVARKCTVALNAVLRDICKSGRKCTGEFTDDFSDNGQAACKKEFGSRSIKNRGRDEKDDTDKGSGSAESEDTEHQRNLQLSEDKFIDFTRQGFFDMTCLHALSSVKEPPVQRTEVEPDGKPKEVNILRNKYEKACKQASFDKCSAACKSATDKTCKKHECIDEKKKAMRKSCKRRCQDNYGTSGGDSSDSDSDSDDSD